MMRILMLGAVGLSLLSAGAGLPPQEELLRPNVGDRGTFSIADETLTMKATAAPFNLLWPVDLQPEVPYRLSYEMRATSAAGTGGVFMFCHNSVPRNDGLKYDIRSESYSAPCTDGSIRQYGICDSSWRLVGNLNLETNWVGYSQIISLSRTCDSPQLVFSVSSPVTNAVSFRKFRLERIDEGKAGADNWRNAVIETRHGVSRVRPCGKVETTARVFGRPGKNYRVMFEISHLGEKGSLVSFDWALKDGDRVLEESPYDGSLGGTWLGKSLEAKMPASGFLTFSFTSYAGEWQVGSQFIRNLKAEECAVRTEPDAKIVLSNPIYKRTIYATSPTANVAGRIETKDSRRTFAVKLVDCRTGTVLASATARPRFEFPHTDDLPIGKYRIVATSGTVSSEVTIRRVPPSTSELTYRGDKMFFNGRPYYFSGVWGPPQYNTEALFYGHARNGIRAQLWGISPHTPEQFLKDLDFARKYDTKLIADLNFQPGKFARKGYFEQWKKDMEAFFSAEVRAHPAFLCYYLCDEPSYGGTSLEALKAAYEAVDELDPYHPCWINEAPITRVNRLKRGLEACDAYGVDIYPVPASHAHSGLEDREVTSVGGYATLFKDLLAGTRPTFLVLQGMSWDTIAERPNPSFPTLEQMRFMSFDAVVHGTSGSIYWGMWHTWSKQANPGNIPFYADLLASAKEIRDLDALWVAGNTLPLPQTEGIMTFAAVIDGCRYIVALNRTAEERKCAFPTTGLHVLPGGAAAVDADAVLPAYHVRVFAERPSYPTPLAVEIPFDGEMEKRFQTDLLNLLKR